MSIFDKLKHDLEHAFHPVTQVAHDFNPSHVADAFEHLFVDKVKKTLPGHVTIAGGKDTIRIAQPSAIAIDVFASIEVALGVDLGLEFGMGIVVRKPLEKLDALIHIEDSPPETVHQLCDQLWSVLPSEIHIYGQVQAVAGVRADISWDEDDVMQHLVEYLGHKGWLEKRLRP